MGGDEGTRARVEAGVALAEQERSREEGLAERLGRLTPEQRSRLAQARKERSTRAPVTIQPRAEAEAGPAPLSYSQEALWFLDQWDPGAPTNHGARVLRFRGDLDVGALEQALNTVVRRHESLRSVFRVEDGRPVQMPLEDLRLVLPLVDLEPVPENERDARLRLRLREESRKPFDLEQDTMLRPVLFRVRTDEHVLLMTMHHIAADGWSGGILNLELSASYAAHRAGRDPDLPPLPIQYADFAAWQRSHLQGAVLDDLLRHWSAELEGAPPRLRLPTDLARPEVQLHRGRHLPLCIEGTTAEAVRDLARDESATAYMVLLSAFCVLLYRFAGQDDVVVGTPVANRNHVEVENLIGLFSNTVVVRARLAGNPTFRDLVGRVRTAVVGAYQHQELPFEMLVQRLKVPRDPGYNPLFQVNFRANAAASATLDFPGLTVTQESVDIGFSRFDLALELRLEDDSITGYLEYDEELFEESTIGALAADLETVLGTVADDPDRRILAFPSPKKPRAGAAAVPRASN